MYKLTFTLKQHTPIIHFQHEQEGATLRASEVKPKLDRFIINEFGGSESLRTAHPEWFISHLNDALNYQMKVSVSDSFSYPIEVPKLDRENRIERDNRNEIRLEGFPCFFGNLGTQEPGKDKKFVFTQGLVTFVLSSGCFSFIQFLNSNHGEQIRSLFFNKINFATRQSKGFGSFSTTDDDGEVDYLESKYYFDVPIRTASIANLRVQHNIRFPNERITEEQLLLLDKWRKLSYQINLFHKVLKSGYNQQGGYVKSSLFKYFKDVQQIQWDKKTIKEEYFLTELNNQIVNHNSEDIVKYDDRASTLKRRSINGHLFLVRDLLGLTSEAEWKGTVYSNSTISKTNDGIDRFKSPITYKPIMFEDEQGQFFRVFLFFEKIPDGFMNKSFDVKSNKAGNLILDTPERSAFSLTKYFNYLASNQFDINDLINIRNSDTNLISNMYNMLKSQDDE